jgi:hypothetical protein
MQVLMLKSLLSRAEIEKRKLQLQLDIKVRVFVIDTKHVTVTHTRQVAENKELARTCQDLRSGAGNLSPMTISPRELPP